MFKLGSYSATPEQWKEWLRVPLEHAAARGNLDLFSKLLGAGADASAGWRGDVNSRLTYGTTTLHVAAESDQAGAVHALIEAGADIETDGEKTPLSEAIFRNSPSAMLALFEHGANVNARDKHDWTPLHFACFEPQPGVQATMDLLLRWGADETAVDHDGQTILDMLEVSSYEASEDEVDNVRLLLIRAANDRVWRQRSWLVMLRARASRARTVGDDALGRSCSKSGGGSKGE
eukprot:g8179.t1